MSTNNTCGDSIRVVHPLFPVEGEGSIPISPLQFQIIEINRYRARDLNKIWHSRLPEYDTGFCLNSLASYGLEYKNVLFGIAIWTNPVAPNLPQHTWLELRRMALSPEVPRNTASHFLAVMTRLIRKRFPKVTKLISYQDVEVHKGTIYKASGWVIGGHHKGGSWNRPNSKNKSTGKPRARPDLNKAIGAKIRWEKCVA